MQPKYFIAAITLLPFTGSAENPSFGDWEVDLSAATVMTEAFTENSSGSLFGLVCIVSDNNCVFYISSQTTCEEGSSSLVLINTEAGALTTQIDCLALNDTNYNIIRETDAVHDAVTSSKTIGIALPMHSGQFKVVRFSLVGSNAAIEKAAQRALDSRQLGDQFL